MHAKSCTFLAWTLLALLGVVGSVMSASLKKRAALSAAVKYYEELDYDHSHLLREHQRLSRRSAAERRSGTIRWSFHAHNRDFTMQISPDPDLFTKDFSVETDTEVVEFDRNRAYFGHIIGNAKSQVAGILLKDGRFEGKILDGYEDFFVEKAETYASEEEVVEHEDGDATLKHAFHSVIYKLSDVNMAAVQNSTDCKSDLLRASMRDIARNIQIPQEQGEDKSPISSSYRQYNMYSPHHGSRERRAVEPLKTMCELYIQADHLYYEKWNSNVDTVIEQITKYMAAVNGIFSTTDFDGDGVADDIRFAVKRLKIWTSSSASGYPFASNLDVRNFLEAFSEQDNFDSFCLAYTFSHRDFNDGTLGLAWTANMDTSGGVCTKNGLFNGVSMSLNTGIVTTLNYQQEMVFGISQLTFAHELGHNLGSEHDDESSGTCSPGSANGGNYIMFPKATDGDKQNNKKFSSCSISMMNEIMNAKARVDTEEGCFKAFSATVCGNKLVEAGEDCDCGWDDECAETCCNPQMDSYDSATYTPCTYTNSASCSPSEGACCSNSCTLRPASDNFECRSATSCLESAKCDGTGLCPASVAKPDTTDCSDSLVCYAGECSNAICQAFGYEFCQCAPDDPDNWNDEKLCQLCCVDGGSCTPSSNIAAITKDTSGVTGQPCYEYQGFCDKFLKCRQLDPVGTLGKLKQVFLTPEGLASVTEWLKNNWYIVAASGAGFVIILALIVRFCAKHEPIIPENKVHPKD